MSSHRSLVPSRLGIAICAFVVFLVGFCLGFIGGYYNLRTRPINERGDPEIQKLLLKEIKPNNIRTHLRRLTERPHLSGTVGDKDVVDYISGFWKENGLNPVRVVPYDVLLSYPDASNPNRIEIRDENGRVVFTTQMAEAALGPEVNESDTDRQIIPPFNAYSAAGNPQGHIVYVNYGRIEDFEYVSRRVNITGSICIARYGKIFRGNKASFAEKFGCAGLILYSDPADYATPAAGTDGKVYPDSWWLPGTGVQRGSLKLGLGDPLTPLYPATEHAHRLNVSRAELPRIPVQPIGYSDARILMENMTGEEAPTAWRGRLLDVTYRLGPGFVRRDLSVQMHVATASKMGTTYNVIGFIEGNVEPDRYVIVGNHHDAWVYGAVDPSSGTAVMLELSRAVAKLVAGGWRPRRTIVFCAWGAEEQGLIGSREWVENFGQILGHRAVAYLNVDLAVQGNFTFRARALPLLNGLLYDVAKSIPNPDAEEVGRGRPTVYDTWSMRYRDIDDVTGNEMGRPRISLLGSGSDFDAFVTAVGVTSADLRYHFDESLSLSSYPLYHSAYETRHLFETYIDPSFAYSTAVCRIWAEVTRRLADYVIVPFNATDYAVQLERHFRRFEKRFDRLLKNNSVDLTHIERAIDGFKRSALLFEKYVAGVDVRDDVMAVRRVNDQLIQLERVFIDPAGVRGRPGSRHVLFAPSAHDSYASSAFPGLVDSLFRIETVEDDAAEKAERWDEVKKQLSIVSFFVNSAAASLSSPTKF